MVISVLNPPNGSQGFDAYGLPKNTPSIRSRSWMAAGERMASSEPAGCEARLNGERGIAR
jgi:hypothetical protein